MLVLLRLYSVLVINFHIFIILEILNIATINQFCFPETENIYIKMNLE